MNQEFKELKDALEYQVDVVLKLEDERLLLLKENNLQKDKLKEMNKILQKYLGQQLSQIEKASQTTQLQQFSIDCQTEMDEVLSDYSLSNSTVSIAQSPLDEAKSLLKTTSRMPVKKLKFCGDSYKENKQEQSQSTRKQEKDTQGEILTKEIINLTKQIQQLKLCNRNQTDSLKKYEKETQELVKHLEVKNEMLNKLRNENAEMAIIINQDKFKSIRNLDSELKQERDAKLKLQSQLQNKNDENIILQRDLKQFREVLGKLTEEFEKYRNMHMQSDTKQDQKQELNFLSSEIQLRDQSIEELKSENDQLSQEVDYFRSISCKQREIAKKQEEDLDFYRELLVKHKIISRQ